MVTCDIHC